MMKDAGWIRLYTLENRNAAASGKMPDFRLVPVNRNKYYFEERVIGMTRQYAAKGANEQVDLIARIWREPAARIEMYAIVGQSDGHDGQYRIRNVQNLYDEDNLKVTDLTLERTDKFYDIAAD